MLQPRGDPDLAQEAFHGRRIVTEQLLQRDLAIESQVARSQDATDAAARDFFLYVVAIGENDVFVVADASRRDGGLGGGCRVVG